MACVLGLLVLLINQIQIFQEGKGDSMDFLWITLEIIGLVLTVLISNPFLKKSNNENNKSQEKQKTKSLDLKIRRNVQLNTHYTPKIVVKCPKCGFENPSSTKNCYNCFNELSF